MMNEAVSPRRDSRAVIENILCHFGLEMTPQCFAILEYLIAQGGCEDFDRLCSGVTNQYPKRSIGAVHKTLRLLLAVEVVVEKMPHDGQGDCYSLSDRTKEILLEPVIDDD